MPKLIKARDVLARSDRRPARSDPDRTATERANAPRRSSALETIGSDLLYDAHATAPFEDSAFLATLSEERSIFRAPLVTGEDW